MYTNILSDIALLRSLASADKFLIAITANYQESVHILQPLYDKYRGITVAHNFVFPLSYLSCLTIYIIFIVVFFSAIV